MDITRYIGQYLLKNQFCYVHGLGNLEIKKRPANYEDKALQGPSYEVVVTPGGSIDDNLANFIATNEQISISKAANALRDFSSESRTAMAAGGEVAIPNIGKLIEENGKVKFITDPGFSFVPAGIPTVKNSKQLDEQKARMAHKPSYPPPQKADSVNWSMVVLLIVLLLIIGGGIFGIFYYSNQNKTEVAVGTPVVKDTIRQVAPPPPVVDTSVKQKDTATVAPVHTDSLQMMTYKMVIGDYKTRLRAEMRVLNLTKGGNHVEMIPKDSTNFLVISTVSCKASDTTHVMDSLRRMFGYKGVAIYK